MAGTLKDPRLGSASLTTSREDDEKSVILSETK
jgi:hypothetical protein